MKTEYQFIIFTTNFRFPFTLKTTLGKFNENLLILSGFCWMQSAISNVENVQHYWQIENTSIGSFNIFL